MNEKTAFKKIQSRIELLQATKSKPIRIAVNGIEGTGKTVFAEKLTGFLLENDLNAMQVSIDGFHFNKAHRYRQGRNSAKGYYEDSYDEVTFVEKVLLASQKTPATIVLASHDLESDQYLNESPITIADNTILITDGAYLFKTCFREHWDLKIYLKTDFGTAEKRGVARDANSLGGAEEAREKFKNRYHQASKMYISAHQPESVADVVIDNSNFDDLQLIRI